MVQHRARLLPIDQAPESRCHDAHVGDEDDIYLWTAFTGEDGRRVVKKTSLKEARRIAARKRRKMEIRFRRAPFPLYGLPLSREGGRFLGGGGWGTHRGRETIHALSLVHGVLIKGEGPMLVVETAVPDATGGGGELRMLAEAVWSGRAEDLPSAIGSFAEQWGEPFDDPRPVSHAELVVPVDGTPVTFDMVSQQGRWVGRAGVDGFALTVEGDRLDADAIELVTITDVEPYIRGSREFDERARRAPGSGDGASS
jgi:hypothetical protein